jgi:hypothetical protein
MKASTKFVFFFSTVRSLCVPANYSLLAEPYVKHIALYTINGTEYESIRRDVLCNKNNKQRTILLYKFTSGLVSLAVQLFSM